jgi:hypothetical protein
MPATQSRVAICHLELALALWFRDIMDGFQRCVRDLESIDRLLELPHGQDIAVEMYREMLPYLWQLAPLKEHDPTGAVDCLFDYAERLRARLGCSASGSGAPPSASPVVKVA